MRNGYTVQHVIAGLVVLMIAVLVSWQRLTPVTVLNSWISPQEIVSGDKLLITRDYQWHRSDCSSALVEGWIIDALGFRHMLQPQHLEPINFGDESIRVWPTQFIFPAGKSTYLARLTFFCPPFYSLWPEVLDLPSLDFKILETPLKRGKFDRYDGDDVDQRGANR